MGFNPGDTGHVTEHNRVAAAYAPLVATDAWGTVEQSSTVIVRRCRDSAIVSQGSDAATVINAGLVAANGDGGGLLRLGGSLFNASAPVSVIDGTGLIGNATLWEGPITSSVIVGSTLKAAFSDTTRGVVELNGKGAKVKGIGLHGNGYAARCARWIGGNNAHLSDCVVAHGYDGITAEGGSGTYYDFNITNVVGWDFANNGVYAISGTDGKIIGSRFSYAGNIVVSLGAGGWIMCGCHNVHNGTSTTANLLLSGTTCIVTGNYLDSAHSGPVVKMTGAGNQLNANYIRNVDVSGMTGIQMTAAYGSVVTANNVQTTSGTAIIWTSGGAGSLTSGVIAMNQGLNCSHGFVTSDGSTEFSATTTSALTIYGNTHTG